MSLSIRLHSIRCLNESNEASSSDEAYVLVTVATLRQPLPGVPALPNFRVFKYGIFEDMDDDDPGPVVVGGPGFWGMDGVPAEIIDPSDVAIVVSVLEQDNGVPEQYQEVVNVKTGLSLAASVGAPTAANRATRLTDDIRNVLNGIDLPIPLALDDDHVGTQQMVLSAADLIPTGQRDRVMRFNNGDSEFELVFRTERAPHWHGHWFRLADPNFGDGFTIPEGAPVSVVSRTESNIDLFVSGRDGAVYSNFWNSNGWNGHWFRLADPNFHDGFTIPAGARVAAVSRAANNLDLFAVGHDGAVYSNFWNSNGWNGHWFRLADPNFHDGFTAPPGAPIAAVCRTPNNIDLFVSGRDGGIYGTFFNADGWHGHWFRLADPNFHDGFTIPEGAPVTAVSRAANNIDLYAVGRDGGVYSNFWNSNGWNGHWFRLADPNFQDGFTAPPGAALSVVSRTENNLDLYCSGRDGAVYSTFWNAAGWHGHWFRLADNNFQDGFTTPEGAPVSAVSRTPNNIDPFTIGRDGAVYGTFWNPDGWFGHWFRLADPNFQDGFTAPPGTPVGVVSRADPNIDLFVSGRDGGVYGSFWG